MADTLFSGPIVRISPHEVHVNDPAFFNEMYSMTKKLHKDPWFYSWLDRNGSVFATMDPDLHKLRSAPVKKLLSPSSVGRIEPVLKDHLQAFMHRLGEFRDDKKTVPLSEAYRALAVDIVSDLSLPESMALLKRQDFGAGYHKFTRDLTCLSLWNRQFPMFTRALQLLPRWFVALQGQAALDIVDAVEGQKDQARRVVLTDGKPISTKNFPVILNEVYRLPDLPLEEKTEQRLFDEIAVLMGAGAETTSHSLLIITYHVLTNQDMHELLKEEIRTNFSKEELQCVLSYKRLENLPFLTAVILEGLRLASSVPGRLPRVNKVQATTYTDLATSQSYLVPAGYPISMCIRDMHFSPKHFPNPQEFQPWRFLGEERTKNDKWFAAFGKGARSCVGRNLAMAEVYMAIGNLFGRCEVKLAPGVERADVEMVHDCFMPFIANGRQGVMVDIVG